MAIRLRSVVKFPARVIAEKGIRLELTNGTYRFAMDYDGLMQSSTPPGSALVAYIDPDTGEIGSASLTALFSFSDNLTAISNADTAADKMGYWTGAGSYALADFTAFARTLLDDGDAPTARTTLGLAIGSNVQAYSVNLDGFSSKSAPTGAVVGTSDTQTLTNKTISGADNSLTVRIADLSATGTPSSTTALFGDGTWKTPAGAGDMLESVYDPNNVAADTFARANHTGTQAPTTVTYQRAESGSKAQTVYAAVKKLMWVTDFKNDDGSPVAPDGWTNSTTGLNKAVLAASALGEDLHWEGGPGPYVTDGLVLGASGRAFRNIGHGSKTRGLFYPGCGLMLAPGLGAGTHDVLTILSTGDAEDYYEWDGINVFGNAANNPNVSFSRGIVISDDVSAAVYPVGAVIRNTYIQEGKTGGLYVGKKRRTVIENFTAYMCGYATTHSTVDLNTYDVYMRHVNIGNGSGTGLLVRSGAQMQFNDVAVYFCDVGARIYPAAVDIQWNGGSIDHNKSYGLEIQKSNDTNYLGGPRMLSKIKFLQNGTSIDNNYYDVIVQGADAGSVLSQCYFFGHAEDAGKRMIAPLVFVDTNARMRAIGCNFATSKYSSGAISPTMSCVEQTACKTF